MDRLDSQERTGASRSITAARLWHWATFALGAFGVIAQLWIVATQTLTEEMIQLSEAIRIWAPGADARRRSQS